MKKYELKQVLTLLFLMLVPLTAPAAELEGVKFPDSAQVAEGAPTLPLNGAGIRTRFFFRVYVGALYLESKTTSGPAAISNAGAKRIALYMLRELSSDQFVTALEDGLKNNHAAEQLTKLAQPTKQLRTIFDAVKVAKTGDVIFIDYLPGVGTRITVNGIVKGTISGEDFNRALLSIWLGESPADSDLKQGMLGG